MKVNEGYIPQFSRFKDDWEGINKRDLRLWEGIVLQKKRCLCYTLKGAKRVVRRHYEQNKKPEVVWQSETQIQTKRY